MYRTLNNDSADPAAVPDSLMAIWPTPISKPVKVPWNPRAATSFGINLRLTLGTQRQARPNQAIAKTSRPATCAGCQRITYDCVMCVSSPIHHLLCIYGVCLFLLGWFWTTILRTTQTIKKNDKERAEPHAGTSTTSVVPCVPCESTVSPTMSIRKFGGKEPN